MVEEAEEQEYQEAKKRRGFNFGSIIKNVASWQFIIIIILIIIVLFMWKSKADMRSLMIIGIGIVAFIIFFSLKSRGNDWIGEDVAKRIAVDAIEEKKELLHIPSDSEVKPTNICRLQWRMSEPFEWHVGIKVETRLGRIIYWRVDIHPFKAKVTGIVEQYFTGKEKPDIILVAPDFRYNE